MVVSSFRDRAGARLVPAGDRARLAKNMYGVHACIICIGSGENSCAAYKQTHIAYVAVLLTASVYKLRRMHTTMGVTLLLE